MPSLLRRSLAELLGTFALIFIGVGSVASKYYPDANYGILGIAVAHAIVLSVMITATMAVSGGHLNPAVTIGLLVARRTTAKTAVAYIVAQLAGGVLGALAVKAIFPVGVTRSISLGTPSIAGNVQLSQAIGLEAILTFFLVSAVFGTCVNSEAPKVGGFGVGLVLLFDIIVGGPVTGAAMNPARAFGPALVSGQWVAHIVYWIGPILGAIVAALLWEHVLLPPRQRKD
ncbi:MAG TPA: aquaporin [Gemmatimonadales bacterium]|nr:aquaporin [Gemmatimonadales bacterium]